MVEERNDTATGSSDRSSPWLAREVRVAALACTIALLVGALIWLVRLEATLPDIRAPQPDTGSEALSGQRLLMPGYRDIAQVETETEGDWIRQEVGDREWLATEEPGSRLRAAFYGTELELVARVGPEAGRVYVMIDGSQAGMLASDESGAYADLWAIEATDQSIQVATGLAHEEHVVEIVAGEGEVAIAGFDVISQTPFPWAFVLAYLGVGGALFVAVRQLLYTLSPSGRSKVPAPGERSTPQ